MKKAILVSSAMLIFLLGMSGVGSAALWYVDSTLGLGTEYPLPPDWGKSWDQSFKTIQQAIDEAADYDLVLVRMGAYEGGIIVDKAVGIFGGLPPGSDIGLADRNWELYETSIEPKNRHNPPDHLVKIIVNDVTFDGFNICKGGDYLNDGGGIYIHEADPTIRNCVFNGNQNIAGGAIYNYKSNPNITTCKFIKNRADYGGAIYNINSEPLISGCYFSRNSSWSNGGAISNVSSKISISDCDFVGNFSNFDGGAIYENDDSQIYCEDSYFLENEALGEDGGAVHEGGVGSFPVGGQYIRCEFYGNRAEEDGGAIKSKSTWGTQITSCKFVRNTSLLDRGGAVQLTSANDFLVNGCSFTGNSSDEGGGAINVSNSLVSLITKCDFIQNSVEGSSSEGGAILVSGSVEINDCSFTGNAAPVEPSGQGGAIKLRSDGNPNTAPTVKGCTFEDNVAKEGGAIYVEEDISKIYSSTFFHNVSSYNGGAIYIDEDNTSFYLYNSIFFGNIASSDGGALYINYNNGSFRSATIAHSTFTGNISHNSGGAIYGIENIIYSDIKIINSILWGNWADEQGKEIRFEGAVWGPYLFNCNIGQNWNFVLGNTIYEDPLFVDLSRGNLHLRDDSPCRDAAIDTIATDPAGVFDIIISPVPDLDSDFEDDPRIVGDLPDIGADEVLLKVDVDIMPNICPNRPTSVSGGILPVAILGTRNFNVNSIDQTSVKLSYMDEEISLVNGIVKRVSRPVRDRQDICDCTTGKDRFNDLLFEPNISGIIESLGVVTDEDQIVLTISGELKNGTIFKGRDCIDITQVKQ